MLEKLKAIEERYERLAELISDPNLIAADQSQWQKHVKEHSRLGPLVAKFREYREIIGGIDEAKSMLREKLEDDFREMVQEELKGLQERQETAAQELKVMLLPKDPNDEKNVVVEVRAGTGGEEAALFAGNLARMYMRYAERMGWKTEILNSSPNDLGGYKEIVFVIEGDGAYSRLKFESGVHRVQRVPETEAQGRIHTSAATVAVLPEAEEVDVEINPGDLVIDTYRASGAGGQHVNKTESAIRITHQPSGIVVTCQDEKSQLKNRDKAMRMLRSKLYEKALAEQQAELSEARRSQVGTGDRSERIRTYNFPQGRVTDHRIGLTLYKIEMIMDGDLDELIDTLVTTDQAERLRAADG